MTLADKEGHGHHGNAFHLPEEGYHEIMRNMNRRHSLRMDIFTHTKKRHKHVTFPPGGNSPQPLHLPCSNNQTTSPKPMTPLTLTYNYINPVSINPPSAAVPNGECLKLLSALLPCYALCQLHTTQRTK